MKKSFIFLILMISVLSLQNALAETNESLSINIVSPESKTYDTGNILLNVTTNKESNINYILNNTSFTGCTNCTKLLKDLNLTEGDYSLTATAFYGNETNNETISKQINFSIDILDEFTLTVNKPENKTYNVNIIPIDVKTSLNANLSYIFDNGNETSLCNNCSSYITQLNNVSQGNHKIKFIALKDNLSLNKEILFNVQLNTTSIINQTNKTFTKFSKGFNKLPKEFASGLISKEELINILENNQLNPGIINRLAKTGGLDKEIIDKIIETQSLQPYGVYKKLNAVFGRFGYHKNKLVDDLINNYNLTENQTSNILKDYKISKKTIKKIVNEERLTQRNKEDLVDNQEIDDYSKEKLIKEGNKKIIEKINKKEKNKNSDKDDNGNGNSNKNSDKSKGNSKNSGKSKNK